MMPNLLALIGLLILTTQVMAGSWTPNNFLYKPDEGARGKQEKTRFDSGSDRIDARLGKEIWVGDPNYGPTLPDAITAIGDTAVILRVPAGTHSINANLTIRVNTTLKVERGGILSIDTGKTLTIEGTLEVGLYQIFSCTGTGKVVFAHKSIKEAYPQWWGAVGDGVADDQVPLQTACNSLYNAGVGGNTLFLAGIFGVTNQVMIGNRVRLEGSNTSSAVIKALAGFPADTAVIRMDHPPELNPAGLAGFHNSLTHIRVDCNNIADIGIYAETLEEQGGLEFVDVVKWLKKGIYIKTGNCQNYGLNDLWVWADGPPNPVVAQDGAIGIHIEGAISALKISRATAIAKAGDATSYAIKLNGAIVDLSSIHVESAGGAGIYVDATSSVVINSMVGHNTVPTMVYIASGGNVVLHNLILAGSTSTIYDANMPTGMETLTARNHFNRTNMSMKASGTSTPTLRLFGANGASNVFEAYNYLGTHKFWVGTEGYKAGITSTGLPEFNLIRTTAGSQIIGRLFGNTPGGRPNVTLSATDEAGNPLPVVLGHLGGAVVSAAPASAPNSGDLPNNSCSFYISGGNLMVKVKDGSTVKTGTVCAVAP